MPAKRGGSDDLGRRAEQSGLCPWHPRGGHVVDRGDHLPGFTSL